MDIGSLFLILALLLLVVLFVARPLLDRRAAGISPESSRSDHELSSLLAERDRILTALQELDFDQALGKIPQEDYPVQRALLVQQGAGVLRQLDRFEQTAEAEDVEARLEAAVAHRAAEEQSIAGMQPAAVGVGSGGGLKLEVAPDDELEELLAARRRARQDKSAGFCPQCGRPVQKSDRFCPKCGIELS